MTFQRDQYILTSYTVTEPGLNSYFSGDIQVSLQTLLYLAQIDSPTTENVRSLDFETGEITGIGAIEYMLYGYTVGRENISSLKYCSRPMVMQDDTMPVSYIFINDRVWDGEEEVQTKLGRQDYNLRGGVSLCAKEFGTETEIEVNSLINKGNHNLTASSIVCDEFRIWKYRTYPHPLELTFVSLL